MAAVKTPFDEYDEVKTSVLNLAQKYNLPQNIEEVRAIVKVFTANLRFLDYLEKCCDAEIE